MEDHYDWEEWDPRSLSFKHHMIAGIIAGVSEHAVFFPIDTLRTNLQATERIPKSVSVSHIQQFQPIKRHYRIQYAKYLNVKQAVVKNGFRVLWRGMSPTITACIPAHALYFSIYESIKMKYGGADNKHILNLPII